MDFDTLLTILYVTSADFDKERLAAEEAQPGPRASLSRPEVVTLALLSQFGRFGSQKSFYRFAKKHLKGAFPTLPHRSQFNRLMRHHRNAITAFALHLADLLDGQSCAYQVLDGVGIRVRNAKRRGWGHLDGYANIGHSNRLGWFEGFYVLIANTAKGAITGFGFGPASTNDRSMAETLLAFRAKPDPHLPSVGKAAACPYIADKGFAGRIWKDRWRADYGAETICVPEKNVTHPWPKTLRRWHASIRQIAETVHDKLLEVFRLDRERPHALDGFQARLAACVGLHNFCMWLNAQLGRDLLAFTEIAELIEA
jgi:hypothetical protein